MVFARFLWLSLQGYTIIKNRILTILVFYIRIASEGPISTSPLADPMLSVYGSLHGLDILITPGSLGTREYMEVERKEGPYWARRPMI